MLMNVLTKSFYYNGRLDYILFLMGLNVSIRIHKDIECAFKAEVKITEKIN